jgi:hypothetical protein
MRFFMYPPFLVLLLAGAAGSAQAACYADYKASREDPLELQYGVAEIFGDCSVPAAQAELTPRLAADDWQLLEVIDTFDETGLEARRESAGEYFLRY